MHRIYYEEIQRYSDLKGIWFILIAVTLIPLIGFYYSAPNEFDVTQVLVTVGVSGAPVVFMLGFARFHLKVDAEGIHYRFIPKRISWQTISLQDVISFEVTTARTLQEKISIGYFHNRLRHSIRMNITGKKFIHITLRNGRKLKIGSENPGEVEYVLKRLTT